MQRMLTCPCCMHAGIGLCEVMEGGPALKDHHSSSQDGGLSTWGRGLAPEFKLHMKKIAR